MARVLAGDQHAFGDLVRLHQRRLYWSSLRILGEPDEAEDVVQEAFVRAYAHLPDYDPALRFYPWMFRIARNLCLNRLRRRKLWGFVSLSGDPSVPELRARDDPEGAVRDGELAHALAVCLASLPRGQRECFRLRHEEDFSYAEISHTLRIPVGTVMSRLSRARETMRRCLLTRGVTLE